MGKTRRENTQGAVYKIKCLDCGTHYNQRLAGIQHPTDRTQAVVTSTIAQLNVIGSRTTPSTKTFSNAQPTTLTVFQRLTLESCFTYLERSPLDRYQQLPAPNKRYIDANY